MILKGICAGVGWVDLACETSSVQLASPSLTAYYLSLQLLVAVSMHAGFPAPRPLTSGPACETIDNTVRTDRGRIRVTVMSVCEPEGVACMVQDKRRTL